MTSGYAFISANYQLLPPASGHDIIEDIKCLFAFLGNGINEACKAHRHGRGEEGIDVERVAVMGTSAGGLCAYLAGIHAVPKPRAVVSVYGMGGNFFVRPFDCNDSPQPPRPPSAQGLYIFFVHYGDASLFGAENRAVLSRAGIIGP